MRHFLRVIALLLCAIPARAQITHVANDHGANGTTSAAIPVTACGSSDLAVVFVEWVATNRTATVSGNVSGAYTASVVGKKTNGTTVAGEMFFKQNCGADTTVTVTCTSCTSVNAQYMEFAGAATSGGEDGTNSGIGTNTTPVTGTLTSTGTTDVVVGGAMSSVSQTTWTAGSGFTQTTSTTIARVQPEWKVFTSAVNQTVGQTITTSTAWVMTASAFKAAAGPVSCTPTLTLMGVGKCG